MGFAVITTHLFDVVAILLRLLFVALRLLLEQGLKATSVTGTSVTDTDTDTIYGCTDIRYTVYGCTVYGTIIRVCGVCKRISIGI